MGSLSVIPLLRTGFKSDLRSDPSAGNHFYSNSGCARSCILSCARDAWKFDLVHGRTWNQQCVGGWIEYRDGWIVIPTRSSNTLHPRKPSNFDTSDFLNEAQ